MGPSIKSVSYMSDSIAKEKKWGKKCLEIVTIRGGVRRLMEKTILNFHFDYLNSSLISAPKTFISQLEAFTERRFNGRKTASRLL